MGFDLFLAAVSIVAASIATWALLRLFPSSDARQAIPLRTDGGFADPSHTTDGGVTIDGKVTADGESTSDIDGQPTDHLGKRRVINAPRAERIRFQHFPSPRNYRYGWPQPTAQRNGRLQQCYYIQADFFALRFLVARMNSASSSAANTIPIGYATAVL